MMDVAQFFTTLITDVHISAIGVAIVGVIYALAAIVLWFVWRAFRGLQAWRWLILVPTALAILVWPLADEVAITHAFKEACKDAGVHVTRVVEVAGYYNETTTGPTAPGLIPSSQAIQAYESQGYRFYERVAPKTYLGTPVNKISHVEKIDGQWRVTVLDRPTARYHFKFTDPRQEVPYGRWLQKLERQVVDTQTGEIVGRETKYNRYPGWVEGLWLRLLDSGLSQCPDPGKYGTSLHLPEAVLKPQKG